MNHRAIRALYPTVVTIDDGAGAFDAEGNPVEIDMTAVNAWTDLTAYKEQRRAEYPPFADYLDGIVKSDQTQIAKYVADCLAVKAKYPKP